MGRGRGEGLQGRMTAWGCLEAWGRDGVERACGMEWSGSDGKDGRRALI